jgi:hypothetical protein
MRSRRIFGAISTGLPGVAWLVISGYQVTKMLDAHDRYFIKAILS